MKNFKFILLGILFGVIFGSSSYFGYKYFVEKGQGGGGAPPTPTLSPIPFSYSPVKPVENSKIKAVVVIGSAGFDGFIIKIDEDKNWEAKKLYWGKESEIWEGDANSGDIMQGFRNFLTQIGKDGKQFGAKNLDRRVSLIISSGALKANEATSKIIRVLKKNGWNAEQMTSEKEAKYGFLSAVPKEYRNSSFMVDIGSGNTKIAWQEGDKIKTLEGYGSKAYKLNIELQDVYRNIKNLVEDIPEISRKRCFMIGGIPFKLAKKIRNNKEKYTSLLEANEYNTSKFKPKNREKMEYGLKIYQAIEDGTATHQYIFPWDANFAIGYLIDKKY